MRSSPIPRPARTTASAALVALAFTAFARNGLAIGPVDVEVAGKAGYTTSPFTTGPNPLAFGLGARLGGSIAGFYLGASAMFFAGTSASAGSQSQSEHGSTLGLEGGYGATVLDHFKVRGLVGVGQFAEDGSGVAVGGKNNLYLEPGLTCIYAFGPIFVGASIGAFLLPSAIASSYAALAIHAEAGASF